MAEFPNDIFDPRTMQNLPGLVRDPADTKNLYAEDYNEATAEIVAVEETLGTTPQGIYSTVKAWLTSLTSALAGKQDSLGFTAENVANKSIKFFMLLFIREKYLISLKGCPQSTWNR